MKICCRTRALAVTATCLILGAAGFTLSQLTHAQATPASPTSPTSPPASQPGAAAGLPGGTGGAKVQVESQVIDVSKLATRTSGVGTRRDMFDGPTRTLLNLEGHISTLNPGQSSHAPHQHVNEEFILLTKGRLEVGINGKISIANAGDLFFFASNDWHNVKSIGDVPAEYYVFNYNPTPKLGFVPPVIPAPAGVTPPATAPAAR